MLEGAWMIPRSRYTSTIFVDNDLIYSEWGHDRISLSMWRGGGLAKIN